MIRNIRTDLALELRESYKEENIDGINVTEKVNDFLKITEIEITDEKGAKSLGKDMGKYITLESVYLRENNREVKKEIIENLVDILKKLIKPSNEKSVVVVGLGNRYVTPDALGPQVVERMLVTRHLVDTLEDNLKKSVGTVSAVSPGVLGITGIETAEIIKGIAEKIKPSLIIAIDALAARSVSRINSTIQITDTGICPGGGMGNERKAINRETMGVDVIAIGVPTVVDAGTLINDTFDGVLLNMARRSDQKTRDYIMHLISSEKYDDILEALRPYSGNMFVTPKEVDMTIKRLAEIISDSLNIVLHPDIEFEDIKSMVF